MIIIRDRFYVCFLAGKHCFLYLENCYNYNFIISQNDYLYCHALNESIIFLLNILAQIHLNFLSKFISLNF